MTDVVTDASRVKCFVPVVDHRRACLDVSLSDPRAFSISRASDVRNSSFLSCSVITSSGTALAFFPAGGCGFLIGASLLKATFPCRSMTIVAGKNRTP